MQFPQLSVDIGPVPAHHQIRNDLDIAFVQDQDVRSGQTYGILDLHKYTGRRIIGHDRIPVGQLHLRCGNVYLLVDQREQRCCGGSHADIGDLTDRVFFDIGKQALIRFTAAAPPGRRVGAGIQIHTIQQRIDLVLRQHSIHLLTFPLLSLRHTSAGTLLPSSSS